MKKIVLGICFIAGASLTAAAQEQNNERFPFHTISKPVQQLAYRNAVHVPAVVSTGNATYVNSKGISSVQRKQTVTAGRTLRANGTPSWVVSKGVARMQYEKVNK